MRRSTLVTVALALFLIATACSGSGGTATIESGPTTGSGSETSTATEVPSATVVTGEGTPLPGGLNATLTRIPYLQSCTSSSVIVVWQTDIQTEGTVQLEVPGGETRIVRSEQNGTEHVIEINKMAPDTSYNYRVLADGAVAASGEFTTAPLPGTGFTFAVLGDSGSGNGTQFKLADVMAGVAPDVVLHTGDVIYTVGAAEDYETKYFEPYKGIVGNACVFPTLGNHDYLTDDGRPYLDVFKLPANNSRSTKRYYSFDYGDVHFVSLDTNRDTRFAEFRSPFALEMKEWLAEDLAAASDRSWTVVFFHHPPYSASPKHGSDTRIRNELSPILEEYEVDLVFNGHNHVYERTVPIRNQPEDGQGVTYIVTGGGGGGLEDTGSAEFLDETFSEYHFVQVEADSDRLEIKAIDLEGVVRDRHTIFADAKPVGIRTEPNPGEPLFLTVCPFDHSFTGTCNYVATGQNDDRIIQAAIEECPLAGCTVTLAPGTFFNRALNGSDKVTLRSNMRLEFMEGSRIVFTGADRVVDRYAISVDGETVGPIENVYVGGPGTISVNLPSDHAIQVKGNVNNIFIGDGLVIEHLDPEVSIDEGIQVSGTIDARNITIDDIEIRGFGLAGGGAAGIELSGTTYDSTVSNFTSKNSRHAVSVRGSEEPASSVLTGLRRRNTRHSEFTNPNPDDLATLALDENNNLFIGYTGKFSALQFEIDTPNETFAEIKLAVSNVSGTFDTVEILADGTELRGVPFGQSGELVFALPPSETWHPATFDNATLYWLRVAVDIPLDAFTSGEIKIRKIPVRNDVSNVTATDSSHAGVIVLSARYNIFTDIDVTRSGQEGVRSRGSTAGTATGNTFTRIHVNDASREGFSLGGSPDTVIDSVRIEGTRTGIAQIDETSPNLVIRGESFISGSQGPGLRLASNKGSVSGLEVRNSASDSELAENERVGILVVSGSRNEISNTMVVDDRIAPRQLYGIYLAPEASRTTVSTTTITGFIEQELLDEGINSKINPGG